MKEISKWWPRNVADYQIKTKHLSMIQHGAYTLLLDHYYLTNKPIPAIAEQVWRICGAVAPIEQDAIAFVLSEFFVERDGFYHHDRVDEELKRRDSISKKRAKAGAKGNSSPKRKHNSPAKTKATANATANDPAIAPTDTYISKEIEGSLRSPSPKKGLDFCFDSKKFINLTDEQIELWQNAYPALNVKIQLSQIAAWLIANPKNRKSNYERFITNWLKREQDRAPRADAGRNYTQSHPTKSERAATAIRESVEELSGFSS